jgi:hypothetical protein
MTYANATHQKTYIITPYKYTKDEGRSSYEARAYESEHYDMNLSHRPGLNKTKTI